MRSRLIERFATSLLLPAAFLFSLTFAHANTRIAVGSFGLAPENLDGYLSDLIAAELSKSPKIDLVERRDLDKALHETTLSMAGLSKAKDAIRVGALLRVDQFLLGTSVPVNGTNCLIVRLVDARSGAIRAINVFPHAGSPEPVARSIANFASAEAEHPPRQEQNYLAIGVIQNLGVNNRFPDFPAQMRGTIAAKLSDKATVLERDVISLLANEIRLNQMSLTESSGAINGEIQFGFWIVDGFYQSYEVTEPEVQLKLRIERVHGGETNFQFQAKPDEKFFDRIVDMIGQVLRRPDLVAKAASPTRRAEIAALEARGEQLIYYPSPPDSVGPGTFRLRTAYNPDKMTSALDEATRVYESILLLDPDNIPAKMRLAACLLYNGGPERDHLAERKARANDYYREVIASRDPQYTVEAQICLADSVGELEGLEMLQRFLSETKDPKARERLHYYATSALMLLEHKTPIDKLMPALRAQLFSDLKDLEQSTNELSVINLDQILWGYHSNREEVVNRLLPDLLEKFPALKPHILLAAAGEQIEPNSPIITHFLASLKQCEGHPETVFRARSYFSHLSTTVEDEKAAHSGWFYSRTYENVFGHHHYTAVIAMALARQRAAEKGLAPPLTVTGKRLLADSYFALSEWQKALDMYPTLPDVPPQTLNECRRHLNLPLQSEELSDSAWKDKHDLEKVEIAYDCITNQHWLKAAAILDSMGHRTVAMNHGGPWGYAFAPVLPAVVADQCRVHAGKPPRPDPMRFKLDDIPYIYVSPNGPAEFNFTVEGEDIWFIAHHELKRFHGPGPFAPNQPVEKYELHRSTETISTSICLNSNFIWVGTKDEGLFELDRHDGEIRHFTMKDGLLLDNISALSLQKETLWIAYRNGDNSGIGSLDLHTRKFSALTPNLDPNAGANAQLSFYQNQLDHHDQAPQLRVSCMTEGAPGEMWFGVDGKGVQSFRISDRRWQTRPFIATRNYSGIATDVEHGKVLVAGREIDKLAGENSGSGGLMIYDSLPDKSPTLPYVQMMQIRNGLPSNELTAVAVDGKYAWVGGRGSVAVVDILNRKVLRIAYLSANCIKKIHLGKRYAWIQVIAGGEDAYPEYSGDARTGIYRIERSAVERVEQITSK